MKIDRNRSNRYNNNKWRLQQEEDIWELTMEEEAPWEVIFN